MEMLAYPFSYRISNPGFFNFLGAEKQNQFILIKPGLRAYLVSYSLAGLSGGGVYHGKYVIRPEGACLPFIAVAYLWKPGYLLTCSLYYIRWHVPASHSVGRKSKFAVVNRGAEAPHNSAL